MCVSGNGPTQSRPKLQRVPLESETPAGLDAKLHGFSFNDISSALDERVKALTVQGTNGADHTAESQDSSQSSAALIETVGIVVEIVFLREHGEFEKLAFNRLKLFRSDVDIMAVALLNLNTL
jgi:hypothetical protein